MADETLARFVPVDEYGSGPGDREIGGSRLQKKRHDPVGENVN